MGRPNTKLKRMHRGGQGKFILSTKLFLLSMEWTSECVLYSTPVVIPTKLIKQHKSREAQMSYSKDTSHNQEDEVMIHFERLEDLIRHLRH